MSDGAAARVTTEAFQALFEQCSNWGRWGPDDERGTLNLITPATTARAAALVREGATVSCAHPLNTLPAADNHMPATHLMLRAGDVATQPGVRSTADYLALAPHGYAHSHLDALCHFFWQGRIYNGRPITAVTSVGATFGSITIGESGIVSRGVLLDLPLLRGVEWLEPGESIQPSELEAAEARAGLQVGEGDILLVRTGRGRRRASSGPWDPQGDGLAGLHHSCSPWLKSRGVAVLGCDGVSDVVPHPVEGVGMPIHILTLVAMGMQLLDNLNLDEIAAACQQRQRWAFLLAIGPLRLDRGTASAVNPIAVF
jgi:kynurenine formamidase